MNNYQRHHKHFHYPEIRIRGTSHCQFTRQLADYMTVIFGAKFPYSLLSFSLPSVFRFCLLVFRQPCFNVSAVHMKML